MRLGLIWFVLLVCAEIWSIAQISHYVGGLATFILLVAGVIFGLQLMRAQGLNAVLQRAQQSAPTDSPLAPLADGIVKAFAGILLIIPGFFSDVIALIILLPFVRKGFARRLAKKGQLQGFSAGSFGSAFGAGSFGMGGFRQSGASQDMGNIYEHEGEARAAKHQVLEGQVLEVTEIEVIEQRPKNS